MLEEDFGSSELGRGRHGLEARELGVFAQFLQVKLNFARHVVVPRAWHHAQFLSLFPHLIVEHSRTVYLLVVTPDVERPQIVSLDQDLTAHILIQHAFSRDLSQIGRTEGFAAAAELALCG